MELLRTVAQLDIELSLVAPRRRGCFEKQRSLVQAVLSMLHARQRIQHHATGGAI